METTSAAQPVSQVNPQEQSREQNIEELLWNRGGDGWGICAVGNMLAAACMPQKEIRSNVVIGIGPLRGSTVEERKEHEVREIAKFTDEELVRLVVLSRLSAERQRSILGSILESDNLITVRKWGEKEWSWTKRTWETGPRRCESIEAVQAEILERY